MRILKIGRKVQEAREDFLLETIEFYSKDPVNLRARNGANCSYSPMDKPGNKGCAIGRHLSPYHQKLADSKDNSTWSQVIKGLPYEESLPLINKVPKKLAFLGDDFLFSIQRLHDENLNWNSEGLSQLGLCKVEQMVEHHDLRKTVFIKYTSNIK